MKKTLEDRRTAALILAVCVVFSVLGLGGWKLSRKSAQVRTAFHEGAEDAAVENHSMEAYLGRCVRYARDLAGESKQYLSSKETVNRVLEIADGVAALEEPTEGSADTWRALNRAVEDLYSELQAAGKAGEVAVTQAYQDYRSALDLIRRDGYSQKAKEYNDLLDGFPAKWIGSFWGLTGADSFGD